MKKYTIDIQNEERKIIEAHNYHVINNRLIFIKNGEKIADYSSFITNIIKIENVKN